AFGALVIGGIGRRLTVKNVVESILQTGQITAMIVVMIIGAFTFMRFLAISKLPFTLAGFVSSLAMQKYVIFVIIIFVYLVLGMFLDIIAAVILTVPIIFPTIVSLGFDPIWFGVIMVLVMEMGLITPPVGMNVFVLSGVTDVPLRVIFRGVLPFFVAMVFCVIIITIFPQIALFIPGLMK
ncbi:MAG: TRAP transporter large permease subunit, partial [Deltaproteobacteria bacterium]|nr:TRAP transporter large permease subunit [Deltaproteobacteria bacterium]